jgi:antitoxin VapB
LHLSADRHGALPDTCSNIRKEGDHLIIEPVTKKGLIDVLAELEDLEMEFPDVDERLPAAEDVTL